MNWRAALCSVGLLLIFASSVWAQDAANGGAAKPQMMAKDADPGWEVVTVKPPDPTEMYGGFQVDGRDVLIRRKTVQTMLLYAYTMHQRQLVNEPDWTRTELWDAKGYADVAGQPDREQMQSLVRKLLAERFGLMAHTEQREMQTYALTVAKAGPKMKTSAGDPNGRANESDRENGGRMTMHAENMSMSELAGVLMRVTLDRPAVDRTGLKGRYDFDLTWTADETRSAGSDAPPGLLTAIQEQLGLKLEPVKAPVDVLVIDKVERPGAN
ncbi:MAG TPA: TIGR03435 family protein [Acidobacteriaceae bacterium]|nr:TIGR03435 family protein [Acidobacteriaceae bacterium]